MREGRDWKPAAATLLAVLTVCSMAGATGTMAKYATSATATASIRVAGWDVSIPASYTNNRVALWTTSTAGAATQTPASYAGTTTQFQIQNDSDVTADISLKVTYVTSRASTPVWDSPRETNVTIAWVSTQAGNVTSTTAVANTHGTWRFEPGSTATFRMTVSRPSTGNGQIGRKCKLFADAVQVD